MNEPNPLHTLLQMAAGYCLPRCLHVVANLGVADALEETLRTAAELAAAVGANPDALGRALRLLSAHGVFVSEGSETERTRQVLILDWACLGRVGSQESRPDVFVPLTCSFRCEPVIGNT